MYNFDPALILGMFEEDDKEEGSEDAKSVMMSEIEDDKNQAIPVVRQTNPASMSENAVQVSIIASGLV